MQLLMGDTKAVILCQSGQENECRPLSNTLSTIIRSSLGVSAVVVGNKWQEAGSQDAVSLYEAIANAKVIISIFASKVEKTSKPGDAIWKRIDEYAWYHCLTYQGPPQQRPKYIPICLQNNSRDYFAQHLRTLRIGRLPKDWAFSLLSIPKSDWNRTMIENLRSIVKALNKGLGTQLTLEDLLMNISFGSDGSEKSGTEKPQLPSEDHKGLVATAGVVDKQPVESKPAESAAATPLVTYECTSADDCTVTVTCSKLNKLSVQPDNGTDKTVVSMNVKI